MIANYKILVFSSSFFLLPILHILLFVPQPNLIETYLSCFLLGNAVFSVLFWHNPIKRSCIHRIDGALARLSLLAVFIYIVFIKEIDPLYTYLFFGLVVLFLALAKVSNTFSRRDWCSESHILNHFFMHMVGISGSYIAFI
jgi:hypothetical protein